MPETPYSLSDWKSRADLESEEKRSNDLKESIKFTQDIYHKLLEANKDHLVKLAQSGQNQCQLPSRWSNNPNYKLNHQSCFRDSLELLFASEDNLDGRAPRPDRRFNPENIDYPQFNQELVKNFGRDCRVPLKFKEVSWHHEYFRPKGYQIDTITWQPLTWKEKFWHFLERKSPFKLF